MATTLKGFIEVTSEREKLQRERERIRQRTDSYAIVLQDAERRRIAQGADRYNYQQYALSLPTQGDYEAQLMIQKDVNQEMLNLLEAQRERSPILGTATARNVNGFVPPASVPGSPDADGFIGGFRPALPPGQGS